MKIEARNMQHLPLSIIMPVFNERETVATVAQRVLVLTLFSNSLTNLNMTDVETGYKGLRGDISRNMIIESVGFGIEI